MQVHHLKILGRMYVKRNAYSQAAAVWQLLGLRRSVPGESSVSLNERLIDLADALIQVSVIAFSVS